VPPWAMHLYTVLLDYAGGTYVSQLAASDEQDALRRWLDKLGSERTAGEVSDEVATAFESMPDRPVLIEGLTNAWSASASEKGGLALVNIVRNVELT